MASLILSGSVIVVTIAISTVVTIVHGRKFNASWAPISDDEFVAGCPPGTSRDTALRVRRIISDQLGVDYRRVHPDQEFVRDLGC